MSTIDVEKDENLSPEKRSLPRPEPSINPDLDYEGTGPFIIKIQAGCFIVFTLLTQIILQDVYKLDYETLDVHSRKIKAAFALLGLMSFLIQVLLFFKPNIGKSRPGGAWLLIFYTLGEIVICCTVIGPLWEDRLLSGLLLLAFVWKNVFFTREKFTHILILKRQSQKGIIETPKPKFMGSTLFIVIVQIFSFAGFAYARFNYELDIFWFGMIAQILTLIHWSYLLKVGYQSKLHSLLAYVFTMSEIAIIIVFYERAFERREDLVIFMFLYSSFKTIGILKHIYSFEEIRGFMSNFAFLDTVFSNYATYLIVAISMFLANVVNATPGSPIAGFSFRTYMLILVTVILVRLVITVMMKFNNLMVQNYYMRSFLFIIFLLTETYIAGYFSFIWRFTTMARLLILSYLIVKAMIFIREQFILRGESPNNATTRKYKSRIGCLCSLEVIIVLALLFTEVKDFPDWLQIFLVHGLKYLLVSITVVVFIIFELVLIPFLGDTKPFNIIMGLSYAVCEAVVLSYLSIYCYHIWFAGLPYAVTEILRNFSLHCVLQDEEVAADGTITNVRYISMDEIREEDNEL